MLFEVEGRLSMRSRPVPQRPQLDVAMLRDLVASEGYGHWFLFEDALAEGVVRCNAAPDEFELPLAERRDGSFELEIAADATGAWVKVRPAYAGKAVTPDEIAKALADAGVVFGIAAAELLRACETALPERVVAARATPPQDGDDARFEALLADTHDRAPTLNEQGLIDYREMGAIPQVEAGQALMRRTPATSGQDGRDIHGGVLPAQPGHDDVFALPLAGACVDVADANLLRAAVNGRPVREGHGVRVEPVAQFSGVNIDSGNVSFDGTVQVDGEVAAGMKVHATGDIFVTGTVDGGDLDAGGNIQVGGGIIAHAKVRCAGSVSTRFVENSHIDAGVDIIVDDMALQSQLQAGHEIRIGVKSPQRGRLVGGSARAMMRVSTPLLGAATSGVTQVLVGVNPALEASYQDLLLRLERQRVDEEKLQKLVKYLGQQRDRNDMLVRAQASWRQAAQAWAQSLSERDAMEGQLAMAENARVEVGLGVAGAVDIAFGKTVRRLRSTCGAGAFLMQDDQIVFVDPAGRVISSGDIRR